MPIEFPCQQCGEQVRTPDAAAGKKGRCPACGEIQRIPLPSAAVAPAPAVKQPVRRLVELEDLSFADEPAPVASQPEPTPLISRPTNLSRLQPLSELQELPAAPRAQPRPTPTTATPAPAQNAPSIRFNCSKCGYRISSPIALAGKKGACPRCHEPMVIPGGAKPGLTKLPMLTPLDEQSGGLIPLDDAPLEELLPLDGEHEEPPTLIPLGPSPTPRRSMMAGHAANPFGDPLAHLPVAVPSAGMTLGPAAVNPYSSPSGGYASSQRHRRTGLPWDYEGVSPGSFFGTARLVLLSPIEAFQRMSTTGGIGGPMGFAVGGVVLGNLLYLLYYFAFLVLLTGGDAAGALGFTFLVLTLGISMVVALSGATILLIMWSAIVHGTLAALGGGQRGFEATYRTYAYCMGSCALTLAIPCLGGFTYPLGMLILPIVGLRQAHQSEYWQIALASISPFVVFVVVSVLFGFLSRFV